LSGLAYWDAPHLRDVYLGGTLVRLLVDGSYKQGRPQSGGVIEMHGAPDVVQYEYTGATGPLHVQRLEWKGQRFDASEEVTFRAIDRETRAAQTTWFPEFAIEDDWSATEGQTLFSPSRRVAYGVVPEVTLASAYAPTATLNGTEQEVVTSGTPSAGQVKVSSTSGAQWRAVTTPALEAGDVLRLVYFPVFAVMATLVMEYPQHNGLQVEVSLQEIRSGRFD
jgi:hypothetical protein